MKDEEIVRMYWSRDEQAIPATADKYGNYCTSIANNILGCQEDAEECVNDAYWKVWSSIPPHRPKLLSAFLGKIVRNLAFNRYRHNTADKRGGGELPAVLDELSELISGNEDVEQEIDHRELVCTIDAFLGTLSPKKRGIFIRRYWYTDCVSDIAARYGMTEGAVSMTLNRLRAKLRSHLSERGFMP